MSILEESKLKEIKEKFDRLDLQDPQFATKIEGIIQETLRENADKIGKAVEAETIDKHMEKTQDCFKELENLQGEGILDQIEDANLKETLTEQATKGIKDEVAEKESLEEAGLVKEAMKKTTPEDMIEEILKQLEKMIEEKKQAIDKKIEENEAMRKKVIERERLKISRTKVNNLQQKTKELKGTEGKQLNQNVIAAVQDFDKQLEVLKAETSRDGVEIEEKELDEANKKLEEGKKHLDDILHIVKEAYQGENCKQTKIVLMEKKVDDFIKDITPDMPKEELERKAKKLLSLFVDQKPEIQKNMKRMWTEKKISIKRKGVLGKAEELTVMDVMNELCINNARLEYMKEMQKEKVDEARVNYIKGTFESGKRALEAICGEEVLALKTEDEYVKSFKEMEEDAGKKGRKANHIAKRLQRIYTTLAEFIEHIETKTIIPAYDNVVKILENNETVKTENLPPLTLPTPKVEKKDQQKKGKKDFVPKEKTPFINTEKMQKSLESFADRITKNEERT